MVRRVCKQSERSLFLGILCGSVFAAVLPFHAPPVASGTLAVDLHATAAVSANTPVVASFGAAQQETAFHLARRLKGFD